MERTCANVSVKPGELLWMNGAQKRDSLLSKECFALSKVYLALSKVFWVLPKMFRLLSKALDQRDLVTLPYGTSWTPRGLTISHRLGLPKPLRRGSA